ncbi:hypothetical protein HY620_01595 [Candidatus Uhrbacteria bacterium]|nr:hypothetical protein [Candidatus Uhrbacteria bacterium]
MNIAKVIPLVRLPRHINELDYAVPQSLEAHACVGSLVRVPLRKSEVYGIIASLSQRQSGNLKGVLECLPGVAANESDLKLFSWFAANYGVSRSLPAMMMFPAVAQRAMADTPNFALRASMDKPAVTKKVSISLTKQQPRLVRVSTRNDALSLYIPTIRKAVDEQEQVLLLCPTIADVSFITSRLPLDFAEHSAILHSALSKKKIASELERIATGDAHIIVGTRMACMVKTPLLSTIMIDQSERIDHKNYDMNPRYDARDIALHRAMNENLMCHFVSTAPRLEDYYRATHTIVEWCDTSDANHHTNILGVGINLSDEWKGGNITMISDALQKAIRETLEQSKSIFLFLNRKGGERFVVCKDCKHLIASIDHTMNDPQLPLHCPECGSMSFVRKGVGTQTLVRDIKKLFPSNPCIELSRDATKSRSKGVNPPLSLQEPTIIVGTSLVAIGYPELFTSFGLVAVVCADPIMTPHDFRSQETQWQTQQTLFSLAKSFDTKLLVQSFQPDTLFIQSLLHNDYRAFAEHELKNRKTFSWPPYSKIIALKVRGAASLTSLEEQSKSALRQYIERHQLIVTQSIRAPQTLEIHIFEELNSHDLSDNIAAFFSTLPADVLIDVNV